jgi:hypothetical protein
VIICYWLELVLLPPFLPSSSHPKTRKIEKEKKKSDSYELFTPVQQFGFMHK